MNGVENFINGVIREIKSLMVANNIDHIYLDSGSRFYKATECNEIVLTGDNALFYYSKYMRKLYEITSDNFSTASVYLDLAKDIYKHIACYDNDTKLKYGSFECDV